MSTNLAQAYVQILPTTKGIKGNLERELGGAGSTAGSKAGGLFSSTFKKYMGAAAIGSTLVSGMTKSIKEGAALEQSIGGVKTLFGDDYETVLKNADKAFRTAGISANTYMEQSTSFAASLLKSLDGNTKAAAKASDMAIVDMSDNANKFGTDIELIQNAYQGFARQNFTMLDNLRLGFAGNRSGMEELLKTAEKISGEKFSIDSLDDMIRAIHIVQEDLGIAGATADEAATTISGSFGSMKAAFDNFMGNLALGTKVKKSLRDLISTTKTFLVDNLIPAILNVVKAIPDVIGSFMKGNFVGKLMKNLNVLSGKLLTGSTAFIDAGLGLMMKLADGIAKGLPAIIRNLPVIVSNIADIINNNAPKLILTGLNIIKTLAIGIVKAIPVLIQNVPQILSALWKAFTAFNWLNLGRSVVVGLKSSLMGPVQKGLAGVVQTIKAKAAAIVNAFKAPFVKAFSAVKTAVAKIKGIFPLKVGKIFSNLKLPKIAVSGGKAPFGIGGKGKLPNFKVNWNAEGGIFTKPTVIGNQGFGEAGAEVAMPLTKFWAKMDAMAEAMTKQGGGNVHMVINFDGTPIYEGAVNYINGQTLMFGASPIKV